jgi:hypothetical protein
MVLLKTLVRAGIFVIIAVFPAAAFHGGHTGVAAHQLKAACPAFRTGEIELADSVAPPGTLPVTDIFVHESGARCTCTRQRTEDKALRCGPMSSVPQKNVSASSRPAQP